MAASAADFLDATPVRRAGGAAEALGGPELAQWCADLITGRAAYDEPGRPDPAWLGGRHGRQWWTRPDLHERGLEHWPRSWAARTLLHAWDDLAAAAVVGGLDDPAWRLREMCAKACARHEVGAAAERCARLATDDEVPRVRAAVARAVGAIGEAEHATALHTACGDPEPVVRRAAGRALVLMRTRLDREV